MGILDLPEDLEHRLRDSIVEFLARQAEKVTGGEKTARAIRQLSSQAAFNNAFDRTIENAIKRFSAEYTAQDEDLVEAILNDDAFWQSQNVRQAIMTMISRPGSWILDERETVVQHFADVVYPS